MYAVSATSSLIKQLTARGKKDVTQTHTVSYICPAIMHVSSTYVLLSLCVAAAFCPAGAFDFTAFIKSVGKSIESALGTSIKGVKKAVSNVGNEIKKTACKAIFAIGCPVAVKVAGKAIGSLLEVDPGMVATGVELGTHACHVRVRKCKRSVSNIEVLLPFSDEFMDYDGNADKFISYEEFVFAVMRSVQLADPEELMGPFIFSDANGDGLLDHAEFQGAPFLFAHAFHRNPVRA